MRKEKRIKLVTVWASRKLQVISWYGDRTSTYCVILLRCIVALYRLHQILHYLLMFKLGLLTAFFWSLRIVYQYLYQLHIIASWLCFFYIWPEFKISGTNWQRRLRRYRGTEIPFKKLFTINTIWEQYWRIPNFLLKHVSIRPLRNLRPISFIRLLVSTCNIWQEL